MPTPTDPPPDPPVDPTSDPGATATPGTWIDESSYRPVDLATLDTATAGFIGPTRRGPLDGVPALLTSLAEFERLHGDGQPLIQGGQAVPHLMWLAASAYFAEGGRRLRVARVFRPDPAATALGTAPDGIARLRMDGVSWSARDPGRAGNLTLRLTLRNGQRQPDGQVVSEPWTRTRADLVACSPEGVVLGSWSGLSIDPAAAPTDGRRWLFETATPDQPDRPDRLPVQVQAQPGMDVETLLTWLHAWRLAARTDAARWADGVTVTIALQGGHDGLRPGVAELGGASGLARFDAVDDVALLAAPAVLAPDASGQPPATAVAELPAVHDLLLAQAQRRPAQRLERLALLDATPGATSFDLKTWRQRLNARCGALFHPWVQPAGTAGSATPLPPSAVMAGLIARVELERGVWKAPSGEPLRSVSALVNPPRPAEQGPLGALGINLLVDQGPRGRLAWGSRTLSSDPQWCYLSIVRGMAKLQATIERGLNWVVFESLDEALWAKVRSTIGSLLDAEWRRGAFQGTTAAQAYFVRCDRTTMSQADLDAGRLVVQVGVAPLKPAEFMILKVSWIIG